MEGQAEASEALRLWEALQNLSDLLWDRYEEAFLDTYLERESEKYAQQRRNGNKEGLDARG